MVVVVVAEAIGRRRGIQACRGKPCGLPRPVQLAVRVSERRAHFLYRLPRTHTPALLQFWLSCGWGSWRRPQVFSQPSCLFIYHPCNCRDAKAPRAGERAARIRPRLLRVDSPGGHSLLDLERRVRPGPVGVVALRNK